MHSIWSCHFSTRITMAGMLEEDRSRTRILNRWSYASYGRKRYQGWNVSREPLNCNLKQQVRERLWPKQGIFKSHLFREQQSVLTYIVTKKTCGWFWMDKGHDYIRKKMCRLFFSKNYAKNRGKWYIFQEDVVIPRERHESYSTLLFLPETMKSDKCQIIVCVWFAQ